MLIGESGSDVFVLESDRGTDTINDFSDGVDLFGLSVDYSFSNLNITNSSGNAIIADTTDNDAILAIVENVDAADLTTDDFTTI